MQILILAQVILSLVLIVLILFQQRGTALGSIFGLGGEAFATRRGIEKKIFSATIFFAFLFIVLSILNLIF